MVEKWSGEITPKPSRAAFVHAPLPQHKPGQPASGPSPVSRANAEQSAAASPQPDIDPSPRVGGAIQGCANGLLFLVMPAVAVLCLAVMAVMWWTGAR